MKQCAYEGCNETPTYGHGILLEEQRFSCEVHKCPHCYKLETKKYAHDNECNCPCRTRGFINGIARGRVTGKRQGVKEFSQFLVALYTDYACDEHYEVGCNCDEELK